MASEELGGASGGRRDIGGAAEALEELGGAVGGSKALRRAAEVLEGLEGTAYSRRVLGRATGVLKDWKAPAAVAEFLAELQMISNGPVVGRAAPPLPQSRHGPNIL